MNLFIHDCIVMPTGRSEILKKHELYAVRLVSVLYWLLANHMHNDGKAESVRKGSDLEFAAPLSCGLDAIAVISVFIAALAAGKGLILIGVGAELVCSLFTENLER